MARRLRIARLIALVVLTLASIVKIILTVKGM